MLLFSGMLQTSARLLRLLSLFQAQRYWSGADLSSRLRVTARTLRRDVDRLRSLGYPVHSTSGAAGGYQLGAGATLPPLLLDDDEAVAVAVGLRTAASGTVSGIEESSLRALMKLEQVLPSRLRRRVSALHAFIVPLANPGPTVDLNVLSTIAGACRDHDVLRFRYRGRDGQPSERAVEPHRLVPTGHRWYLVAWDLRRTDWRSFRVDRIQSKLSTGNRFTPRKPPEGGYAAYVARAISYTQYSYRARVLFHAPAETISRWIPHNAGLVEPVDERTCTLQTGAQSLETLSIYLALVGVDFEVHEPPELAVHMRTLAERFTRALAKHKV
jgi:predicted DNA-binding transcriptional regulator YafY